MDVLGVPNLSNFQKKSFIAPDRLGFLGGTLVTVSMDTPKKDALYLTPPGDFHPNLSKYPSVHL